MVSTFPPRRCGIADYTAELSRAITARGGAVAVLSERGARAGTTDGVTSIPAWERRENWVAELLAAARSIDARLVHLQHTPDTLGWDGRVPELLKGLETLGIPSVITLHTVHNVVSALMEGKFFPGRFHAGIAARAGAVVVHGKAAQSEELLRQGLPPEKVVVIPHGTTPHTGREPMESRKRLGLDADAPFLLCFGFIHAFKNLHTILRAMPRVVEKIPEVRLLITGSVQNQAWYNRLYLWQCRRMAGRMKQVELKEAFVDEQRIQDLLDAADLVLLPYAQSYGSASGVLHRALGSGKLALCSDSPKFSELGENVSQDLIVPTHDAEAWAGRIEGLLRDRERRETLRVRIRGFAEETAWSRIADQHLALYSRIAGNGRQAPGSATGRTAFPP